MSEYPDEFPVDTETGPLDRLVRASNKQRAEMSEAQQTKARNLLRKAMKGQADGDLDRAVGLVERTQALGFDEYDEVDIASWTAHMLLFTVVTDAMEACDEGDDQWLEPIAGLLAGRGGAARAELADVLVTIRSDYPLSRHERRRIEALIGPAPEPLPADEVGVLDATELLAVLALVHGYETAVPHLLTDPTW